MGSSRMFSLYTAEELFLKLVPMNQPWGSGKIKIWIFQEGFRKPIGDAKSQYFRKVRNSDRFRVEWSTENSKIDSNPAKSFDVEIQQ